MVQGRLLDKDPLRFATNGYREFFFRRPGPREGGGFVTFSHRSCFGTEKVYMQFFSHEALDV